MNPACMEVGGARNTKKYLRVESRNREDTRAGGNQGHIKYKISSNERFKVLANLQVL